MADKVLVIAAHSDLLMNFRGRLFSDIRKEGHTLVVASPCDGESSSLIADLELIGAKHEKINIGRLSLNPFLGFKSLLSTIKLIRKTAPDVVISYSTKPIIFGGFSIMFLKNIRFYPIFTGLGYAFTSGGGARKYILYHLVKSLYRLALHTSSISIFQNPDDQSLFYNISDPRSYVMNGSGVDLHEYKFTPLSNKKRFVMVARLLYEKGIIEYLEAAKIINERYENVSFQLAGFSTGNHNSINLKKLKLLCMKSRVEFVGRIDPVYPLIASSYCFVLPSKYREGVPRTILEALSIGRPIITTDVPGCRETVKDGLNGLIVKPGSVSSLVNALSLIIDAPFDEVQQMSHNSRQLAVDKYDISIVNRNLLMKMN